MAFGIVMLKGKGMRWGFKGTFRFKKSIFFLFHFSNVQSFRSTCLKGFVVKAFEETELIILSMLCDQNTKNVAAINRLLLNSQTMLDGHIEF